MKLAAYCIPTTREIIHTFQSCVIGYKPVTVIQNIQSKIQVLGVRDYLCSSSLGVMCQVFGRKKISKCQVSEKFSADLQKCQVLTVIFDEASYMCQVFAGNCFADFVRCYKKSWQIFRRVLAVKCYLNCRFVMVLCVNTSRVEGTRRWQVLFIFLKLLIGVRC